MGRSWLLCLVACHPYEPTGSTADARTRVDACVSASCEALGATCGEIADGCGQTIACGTCDGPATCGGQDVANVCAIPVAARTCTAGWCWEAPSPLPFGPLAMFATTPSDVWAVGVRGVVMHFDGAAWQPVESGTTADLDGIWMASASDGWIVGTGGVIRRWNGTAWTAVASGTGASLHGVWGRSASDVWFVGDNVAKRWTGTAMTTPPASATPTLLGVFAPTATDVFAVGQGRVWRYDGAAWVAQTPPEGTFDTFTLHHIAGTPARAFAVGRDVTIFTGEELIYRWDGQASWTRIDHPGDPEFTDAFSDGGRIFGVSDESIIDLESFAREVGPAAETLAATGAGGKRFNATTGGALWSDAAGIWKRAGFGPRESLTAIGDVGDSVWFGGSEGDLVEWRGGPLVHARDTGGAIRAVSGASRDDVWIADSEGVAHLHDGSWDRVAGPPGNATHALLARGSDVVALGAGIYHLAAGTWQEEPVAGAAGVTWMAVAEHAGALYAVGDAHVAVRTGGAWTELPAPGIAQLCGVAVTATDDLWVAGGAKVAHWNGSAWTMATVPGAQRACAIAIADGDVIVSGDSGELHHRASDGTWTADLVLAAGAFHALHATATDVWAAGDFGTLLRR